MSDRYDRAVAGLLGAGVAACVVSAALVGPAPLAPADASRWASGAGPRGGAPPAQPWFFIDSVAAGAGAPAAPYAGREITVPRGSPVVVGGWAVDARRHRAADGFAYRIDGGPWRMGRYGLRRDDVAAYLKAPAARDSGFAAQAETAALPPGPHALELATVTRGSRTVLPVRVQLAVTER